ncbi:C-C motif chemokine 1 [Carlito syrichta]|uniref:C-C motif chemokine 1 n=1 Tax=Carlito syrichta TaxID=1868482 RepID=A0A1U7SGX6_CARSF|nr:C-C motif chemokine 1 [Carlito syrichta]
MKLVTVTVTVALVCLMLAGMWPHAVSSKSMHVSSSNCCFSFVEKKISPRIIQCFKSTSSICPYEAFIFKLKGGRETCALKTVGWVQEYLRKVKHCLPKKI